MPFKTKLDFSDNRQVKQFATTHTVLSGGTSFGLTFNDLPSGPSTIYSGISTEQINIVSTFSGNSGTTFYSWYDSNMSLGESMFSAITPSNSGTTQNTGNIFTPSSTISLDGNVAALSYSGVNFDISVIAMVDLGGANYSGSVLTVTYDALSATSLDYSGRTIWVDVSGITRTEALIITENPQIGYVWTCNDSEGRGVWGPASSGGTGSTLTYWSASSGTNAVVIKNSNVSASGKLALAYGTGTTASGNYSHAEGSGTLAMGNSSHAEGAGTTASGLDSHAEGVNTIASGFGSHAEGGFTITTTNYGHAQGSGTTASNIAAHAEGRGTLASGLYSHAEGQDTIASGNTSHAEGGNTIASGFYDHAEGFFTTASGGASHAEGQSTLAMGSASHAEGLSTIASGFYSHSEGSNTIASGLVSHAEGQNTEATGSYSHAGGFSSKAIGIASFVHGTGSTAANTATIVLGNNISGTSANTTYVDAFNIKSVLAGPGVTDLGIDANGNVVDQASDLNLKENINTIEGALSKVLSLRGVTYNWKDREKGGNALKLGFIAQEVDAVIPELAYYNVNGDYMGVHYKDIPALLVEAIKELVSGVTTANIVYLETQTILAEDNNIDLNFNGNIQTAIGGGMSVLHGLGENQSADFKIDSEGNWVSNNPVKPKSFIIPTHTPSSSNDAYGNIGEFTYDDNYFYVKTENGWKRSSLESF